VPLPFVDTRAFVIKRASRARRRESFRRDESAFEVVGGEILRRSPPQPVVGGSYLPVGPYNNNGTSSYELVPVFIWGATWAS